MNYQILVNKKNGLKNNYLPSKLVDVKSIYKEGIKLVDEVYQKWLELKRDVFSMGYNIEIESGYRTYGYQAKILEELIAEKGSAYAYQAIALPGHSEHQTGLALDYCIIKGNEFIIEKEMANLEECIYTNSVAHKYGFIVRYPKDREHITGYQYEPWHLRYVGKDLANYLYVNKLTLDEYYKEEKE